MKRTITTMVLAAIMLVAAAAPAFATHIDEEKDHGFDESQDAAGALDPGETGECRPGADFVRTNGLVSSWELMTMGEYIDDVIDLVTQRFEAGYYGDPTLEETQEEFQARLLRIPDRAQATWDFCDKNRDGLLCVLRTDPSPYWYTLLDNRPFPGS
jgi:hypothetical protein